MNAISLSHFLSYIADILLIIVVIGKNPAARTNQLCAFLIMTFSVWSLSYGLASMAHTGQEALYFFNVGAVGWSIFPIAAVWFYLSLTGRDNLLRHKAAPYISALFPAFFLLFQWTGNMNNSISNTYWGWAILWSQSVLSYLYLAYVTAAIIICTHAVIQYGRTAQTFGQKRQARLLLITGSIAVVLSMSTGVSYQLLDKPYFPQVSDVLVMIWAIGIVFTISWYNLMSITPATVANQILSIMNEAIVLLDYQGQILYANRAATSLHRSELRNLHFHSLVKDRNKAVELLEETRRKGIGRQRELAYVSIDGNSIPVLVSASAVQETSHSIAGFVVSATDISEHKRAVEEIRQSQRMIHKSHQDAVDTIARIMDMRDPYTGGHQSRVAGLAIAIAREMNLSDDQIDNLRMAATVHDIGKINIAADILNKPGALNKLEFEIIKSHAQGGYDIVRGLDLPCTIASAILQHHERLDGSGYPSGLKKAEILLEAKILAVADVIEAMVSHRCYRPALGINRALEEIMQNRDRLYEPAVVDACINLFKEKNFKFS